jgi:hypothetical protein
VGRGCRYQGGWLSGERRVLRALALRRRVEDLALTPREKQLCLLLAHDIHQQDLGGAMGWPPAQRFRPESVPLQTLNRDLLSHSLNAPSGRYGGPFSGHPMTVIDRTAYPRPGSRLTREELRA